MIYDQTERILSHLREWSRYAFDEFTPAEIERAAGDAERDGDYAAAARLRNRAFDKRVREAATPPA